MRAWALSLALLIMAGCGTQPVIHPQLARPQAPIDPKTLAKRLEAMQPGWPAARRIDCGHLKCVALTFDDGPGPYTGKLLDLLRARNMRATFFVLGEMVAADRGGHLVRRIVAEGHELGNHSWSHPPLTGLPDERLRFQLRHTNELVERVTGVRMRVMRPPYGATNHRVVAEARREGLAQILWSVDTLDWRDPVPAIVARRASKAKAGAIVLMHDVHRTTVQAVPTLLDVLEKRGCTPVTISELYGRTPVPGRTYMGG
ncbi:polysaccharide deacetylase family protein [Nonomuraea sp. NEAU-A123]|uniref:polysaccharide deacetylase family protein n=1 Tax=Nonomuraea sp. NEAU-A123 TaxID=2839649 RepID=UPI001BE4BE7A|nr:polysaccharide deacetylase family protein [Nonomuraea sp. NEAU-A123]MBT2228052.1 polysaccharide deacetylase family protein [Nonomuraea sp. NEAU-A123]